MMIKNINIKIVLGSLVCLSLLLGCDNKTEVEQVKKSIHNSSSEKEKNISSMFTLETIEGKKLHLDEIENGLEIKEFKDKAIFLIFFGHRCPPCLAEIPRLNEIVASGHEDLEVVAMEVQGLDRKELKSFAKTKGIKYNLVPMEGNMNFIQYIQVRASWQGAIPFLLGLDKKGKVKIVHTGGVTKSQLEGGYQELIKP